MRIHRSALKHGVDPADSLHAALDPIYGSPLDDEDDPRRILLLGFDRGGRLLELVVLRFDSGNELLIHAMKARPQYRALVSD